MEQYQNLTVTVRKSQSRQRLDFTLAELLPEYSRSQIKNWIRDGHVKINGCIIKVPKEKVIGNEYIEIQPVNKKIQDVRAQAIPLDIIYEDDSILVINKPSNLVVHPGFGNIDGTIFNALLHYFSPIVNVPRAGIVHRLDKETTGLMVVAKTTLAQARLIESLQAREILREYEAIVIGTISSNGSVNQPIARHVTKRTHMTVHPMGKPAVTHYRIIEHFSTYTHLRLRLETGRTHQIRVHMAHINHPLVGDPLYGRRLKSLKGASRNYNEVLHNFNRQALHAAFLRLCHPITSIMMEWHVPLPQDMVMLIATLKEHKTYTKSSLDQL